MILALLSPLESAPYESHGFSQPPLSVDKSSPLGVNNLVNWSTQNNMKLNLKKTWEMVIYELILHLLSCFRCCFLDTIL